jgi:hypothetical protein
MIHIFKFCFPFNLRRYAMGSNSGSATVFIRDNAGSATSGWTQRAKLIAADGRAHDYFGYSVSVNGRAWQILPVTS